jgi:hypothetical protein
LIQEHIQLSFVGNLEGTMGFGQASQLGNLSFQIGANGLELALDAEGQRFFLLGQGLEEGF